VRINTRFGEALGEGLFAARLPQANWSSTSFWEAFDARQQRQCYAADEMTPSRPLLSPIPAIIVIMNIIATQCR
jgi:hypothetical protein